MAAVWTSIVGLIQSLVSPIGSAFKSLAIFSAGKTAADDAARKKESAVVAKAAAARASAVADWNKNTQEHFKSDGFERED